MDVVEGCAYSCDPGEPSAWCTECRDRRTHGKLAKAKRQPGIVDLPVSATEDRLIGTLDLEHALKHGERRFEPGLLAAANRGILYIDEVNLLDDHLVDTLLDAAAMGVNIVEREGVAFEHPARFVLVGTMNPEEGDVRPQLLDRFGLCVDVRGLRSTEDRIAVMTRRRAFEEDATSFQRQWFDAESALKTAIERARLRLPGVETSDAIARLIATICANARVDGHRADLTMLRGAAALAALDARAKTEEEDVRSIAPLVLAHRMRNIPLDDSVAGDAEVFKLFANAEAATRSAPDSTSASEAPSAPTDGNPSTVRSVREVDDGDAMPGDPTQRMLAALDRTKRAYSGRRHDTTSSDTRGRYSRAVQTPPETKADLALDATIRAAAPHQTARKGELAVSIKAEDLRSKLRTRKVGASIVFCVDASGSMGVANRMEVAKAAIFDLLVDAYQYRDRVGLVTFRGDSAEVVLPPTSSIEMARLKLKAIPLGGATPLAHGIVRSLDILATETKRNPDVIPWLVLVTDGRANVALNGGLGSEDARVMATKARQARVNALVIDMHSEKSTTSLAREIAVAAAAEYVRLPSFDAASVAGAVRQRLQSL